MACIDNTSTVSFSIPEKVLPERQQCKATLHPTHNKEISGWCLSSLAISCDDFHKLTNKQRVYSIIRYSSFNINPWTSSLLQECSTFLNHSSGGTCRSARRRTLQLAANGTSANTVGHKVRNIIHPYMAVNYNEHHNVLPWNSRNLHLVSEKKTILIIFMQTEREHMDMDVN
jgi:hypothetical protein